MEIYFLHEHNLPDLHIEAGTEPGLRVKEGKNINNFFFKTPNKHSFSINKPSTKTNTQIFCFLIH